MSRRRVNAHNPIKESSPAMPAVRFISTTIAALAFAASGAAAADAPIVSAQRTSQAKVSPVTFPATDIDKGDRVPRGTRIVYRDVTISGKQLARVTLRAPSGKRVRMIAVRDSDDIAGDVAAEALNRKQVTVRLFKSNDDVRRGTGRLYGLAR